MNKTDLINALAKATDFSKKDSEKAINGFVDVIISAVKKGEKVQLIGFGTFESRLRAARDGVDPRTRQKIKIAACKVPAFKAGKGFKDAVSGKSK